MKSVIILLLVVSVLGGAAFGLMELGVISLGKRPKKPTSTVAAVQIEASPTPSTPPQSVTPMSSPPSSPPPPELPRSQEPNPEEERSLARLTAVYEQMPAEDAGRILAKLPDSLIEKMLRRMDERQAGKILLTFHPNRAARLTQALAK
ncbi:MAG TPA: hypothetical protein VNJ09_08705 [Chthonomonadales bacterium]|nr:hypothetical protein [Chthonomonadales bacterium]